MEDRDQPKQLKTAAELEALILADLLNLDGCPQQGIFGAPSTSLRYQVR